MKKLLRLFNAKVRLYGRIGQALIDAKQSGRDAFAAIEAVMSWDSFAESVTEAQKLAQPDDFDFLHRIGESYATLRRYADYRPGTSGGDSRGTSGEQPLCLASSVQDGSRGSRSVVP